MTQHSVPSDVDADSIIDLVEDCREVSGVLAPFVIDLTNIPTPRGVLPIEITPTLAAAVDGYSEYGS